MSELALKLIKEAKEKRLTRLDLGNCGLTELPDELFELVWLEELILSTQWSIHSLKTSRVSVVNTKNNDKPNTIKKLNPKIKQLCNLKKLIANRDYFSNCEIDNIDVLESLSKLEYLDLLGTKINNLDVLKCLPCLRVLDIRETGLKEINILSYCKKLETLDISSTKIEDIYPIRELSELKILRIEDTLVNDLTALQSLNNLRYVFAIENSYYDIQPLSKLKNLKYLYIGSLLNSNLSPLSNSHSLKELFIVLENETDLIPLSKLKSLDELSIFTNKSLNIQPLGELNLKGLILHSPKKLDLSPLKEMVSLIKLDLESTQAISLEPLKKLINLKKIDISHSKILNIEPLRNLIKLEDLDISSTLISDITPLKNLIEKGIIIGELKQINISNCPLSNPPIHIAKQGNAAILRYWQELENKETTTNNQTKLIYIGNSRAGKTSLWQFLKDKIYNEQADSTHGIKTEIWDTETLGTEDNQNLAAHIWDFGGQEYYHATHNVFLCENTVYVLVWEKASNFQGTKPETFKLDDDPNAKMDTVELEHFPASYWLDNIRYYGGAHCPVLIVQNKVDEEALKANYTEGGKNLPDCFHLSVKNAFEFQQGHQELEESNMDFQKFKLRLLKELRKNATAFKLVKYYSQVREALEAKAKDIEYIAVSELKNIALQFDETPDLENLLAYLKSFTNTVLYFPQNEVLKDRLYLNPTHISRDIYKILNKQVRENNGKFDLAHIKTRLNLNDDKEAERFVALMREFDLIFEKSKTIKGETKWQFITPQYLPKKEDLPDDMQFLIEGYSFETAFTIQFKSFVPRSLMLRFIANNGALSNQETYWRNGIIYKSPTTQSMIKVEYDHDQSTFTIQVQDKQKQTLDMQNIVEQFVKLENSDENIKISNDGKLYVDLRTIRKLQHENRREDIYTDGNIISLKEYNWLITKQKTDSSMTLEELKNQVRALISKAKTKDAMDVVATWAHENNQEQLKDDINLLKGELTTLSRNTTLGLVSHSEAVTQQNQLNNKVLSLVNTIEVSESKTHTHSEETPPKEPVHKKTMDKPLSIFISYSKNDNDLRQELHTHLSSLRRRNIVSNWDDRHIIGGELWDDAIKTKLKEADIILFLVSASFINTDYIWDYEIPIAEEQRRNGKARVIPIILKPCQWTKLDFAKQQALPSKGVPINSFPDRDTAWLEVVESIEKVINDVMR